VSDSICWMGVRELQGAYDRSDLSPREALAALAGRIEDINPQIGAFTTLTLDRAEADARACTEELARGFRRGPLHGIPIAIKELFDVKDARTTYGSMVFRERMARDDAEAVRRLRQAGAVIVGLTRSHEFGWGITTQHALMGGTRNPWNVGRVPGGSSGGAAAAVAAGMVPAALGSDTGGSIRIPAGYCGVAGLKPTYGRVSTRGAVPLAPSLDHPGPIARSVGDLAIAFSVLAGYDVEDPMTGTAFLPGFDDIDRGLADLRIGVAPSLHLVPLETDHAAVYRSLVDATSRAGGMLREIRIPAASEIRATFASIQMAEAYHTHTRILGTFPAKIDDYGNDVRTRLDAAASVDLPQYLQAWQMAHRIRREFEIAFGEADVILTPITAGGPSTIDQPDVVGHFGSQIAFRDLVMSYTVPQNVTGLPACAVPAGFDKDGIPVGVQVTARSGREDVALRVAQFLQVGFGRLERPPRPPALE